MTERRRIALIEVLIGIAVLAGQITFVLPTARAAHEADRQSQRSNKVSQITLSQLALQHTFHNHNSVTHNSVASSIATALGLGSVTSVRVVSGPIYCAPKQVRLTVLWLDRLRFLAPFPE
jgi:hypothetical protein